MRLSPKARSGADQGQCPWTPVRVSVVQFPPLSPRGWLWGSAPEPRFAFQLAGYTCYRRVDGYGAVPLNPGSRFSWPVTPATAAWMVMGQYPWTPARIFVSWLHLLLPHGYSWAASLNSNSHFSWPTFPRYRRFNGLGKCRAADLHNVNVAVGFGKSPHLIDKPLSMRYPIIMP